MEEAKSLLIKSLLINSVKINIKTLCTHVFLFIFSNIQICIHIYNLNKSTLAILKYKTTRHQLWLAISAVNVGLILLSEGNYISREIHECASTVALLKSQTVTTSFPLQVVNSTILKLSTLKLNRIISCSVGISLIPTMISIELVYR